MKGEFWKEICKRMGMVRSLTTACHPQADGQTEVLTQSLEISLHAYISPSRNDWVKYLNTLALSYNMTPHTATGFAPMYLLRGYILATGSTLVHHHEGITRPATGTGSHNLRDLGNIDETSLHPAALEMSEAFHTAYNKGWPSFEFQEGDLELLNLHSLFLLRNETGHGRKLLMKYNKPFEIIKKFSAVSYRLQMPESYRIHPMFNIAHLEKYQHSPAEFGNQPTKSFNCADSDELLEYKVEMIITD